MVWRRHDPQGNEAAKIKWELVPYMQGRCLDLGSGNTKPFPHFVGVDNGMDGNLPDVLVATCEKLDLFADRSCDLVFSSHLLEHIEEERVPATLKEWCRVIKPDGHLAMYLPDEDAYPRVGEPGANPDHKWNVNYARVVAAMETVKRDWDLIDYQQRRAGHEYSLFFVFRMS